MRLSALDLNLLVVFRALFETAHLTKAAAQVGLSQSAMSHALGRLRDTFGDPLFVRSPRGMQPTTHARDLAPELLEHLRGIERLLERGTAFDPTTNSGRVRIATTDYCEMLLWGPLAKRLTHTAPHLVIETVSLKESVPLSELESGTIDLAVGYFANTPRSLATKTLYEEHFLCMLRKRHPALRTPLTLAKFVELGHLLVAPWGIARAQIDDALAKKKLIRRVQMTVPHFSAAPAVIEATDLITSLPARLVQSLTPRYDVVGLALPFPMPAFKVTLLWHPRTHRDPALRWLRGEIAAVAQAT